jgi:predicted acyltransferase (DUF342 family)
MIVHAIDPVPEAHGVVSICDDRAIQKDDPGSPAPYGELVLEANVIIDGSVFADGEIIVGPNANISGHIFSQKAVYICERTVISCPTTLKTVIGKKSVSIEQNVTIYGYVLTEGDGKIL